MSEEIKKKMSPMHDRCRKLKRKDSLLTDRWMDQDIHAGMG
jgi:hypothetical protein